MQPPPLLEDNSKPGQQKKWVHNARQKNIYALMHVH